MVAREDRVRSARATIRVAPTHVVFLNVYINSESKSVTTPSISLLHPSSYPASPAGDRSTLAEADLNLAAIVEALDFDGRHSRFVAGTLAALVSEAPIIGYRQDVLEDLLSLPELAAGLAALLPSLQSLSSYGSGVRWGENNPLYQIASRLAELQVYVSCVEGLGQTLEEAGAGLRAEGWLALRDWLTAMRQEPEYTRLAAELPKLAAQFEQAGSITLGLNLDGQLRPESVTIVSVNSSRFSGKGSLLERLLGDRAAGDTVRGLSGLFKASENHPYTPEHELFRDMNRLLERVAAPVAEALARYSRLSSGNLSGLEPELAFYLGAAKLINQLRAVGLVLCRPVIAPVEERAGQISGSYSLDLALRLRARRGAIDLSKAVVPNEVAFGPGATIFILTGPNSGGKTTYTRAVGQAQVLAQAGLLVPGRAARLSPVDGIYTHFATAERPDMDGGRLAEELGRLAQLFRQASRSSLLLLNEPLASTDHASARALSRDLLAGLRLLGARAIFVTHIHELVEEAATLDGLASEDGVVNLVAEVAPRADDTIDSVPTYTIRPGRPQALGYAAELARQYGLSLAQIKQALHDRGLTSD